MYSSLEAGDVFERENLKWHKTVKVEYKAADEMNRTAKISFIGKKFINCSYSGLAKDYFNAEDWKFIGKVAKKIKTISDKLCN